MATTFANQVAIVTGGARGIGFAIASHLGTLGASVVLADINEAVLATSVEALRAQGIKASSQVVDVTSETSVQSTVAGRKECFSVVIVAIVLLPLVFLSLPYYC